MPCSQDAWDRSWFSPICGKRLLGRRAEGHNSTQQSSLTSPGPPSAAGRHDAGQPGGAPSPTLMGWQQDAGRVHAMHDTQRQGFHLGPQMVS
ncbi:hypothetical protein WJX73_007397 [Symbiochloris irregularis]|uniref:Uncharacterized protein n=1 Tax=Symbiochloris irregularis TaxID=706552 RepID=A0AAW1NXZ0_9CHLO